MHQCVLYIITLVLLVGCGPLLPTVSPTTLPATTTSIPPQMTTPATLTEIPPSPIVTASPVDSDVLDCPMPASLETPSITHFEPIEGQGAIAYSGDGLQLVFPTSLLTTTVHSLSALGLNGVDRDFAWSPDATEIAFLYTDLRPDPCGHGYLMLADLAKGEVRPLIQTLARYGQPVWSPDGRRLALTNDAGQLSIVSLDDDSTLILSEHAAPLSTVAWLDAEHVVYAERAEPNSLTRLVSQNLDGSVPEVLLQHVRIYAFSLAPNGNQVAYDGGGSIYLADLPSNSSESLGPYPSERLQWSPDGKYLLGRGGLAGIFLVQPGDSAPVSQVKFLGLPGLLQSWSPDSSRFAALIGPEGELPTIGIYDVAAQKLTDLSVVVQPPYALAWSTRDSNPTIEPRTIQEEDIREAVFRYQFAPNASGLQQAAEFYCLSLGEVSDQGNVDPSDELMRRLQDHRPPVKVVSQCANDMSQGVTDRATGQQHGLIFRVTSIKWINDIEVEVEGGYYEAGLSASGNIYYVTKESGQWVVKEDKILWIS